MAYKFYEITIMHRFDDTEDRYFTSQREAKATFKDLRNTAEDYGIHNLTLRSITLVTKRTPKMLVLAVLNRIGFVTDSKEIANWSAD